MDSPRNAASIAERILRNVELLTTGTRELVVTGTPYIIPYHARQKWPSTL